MRRGFTYILALAILLLATPVSAESLRMATESLAPYGFMDGGNIVGLAHEIGTAIITEAGFESEETLASRPDALRGLQDGAVDLFIAMPDLGVEEAAVSLGSVFPVELVVLGRHTQKLRALGDVRGKIVAAVKDSVLDERINRENRIMVYPTRDFEHSLKMLMARRVDFTVGPRLGLFHAALRLRLPRKALGRPLTLSTGRYYLYASRLLSEDMTQRLKDALQRLSDEGTLQTIVENYYL